MSLGDRIEGRLADLIAEAVARIEFPIVRQHLQRAIEMGDVVVSRADDGTLRVDVAGRRLLEINLLSLAAPRPDDPVAN